MVYSIFLFYSYRKSRNNHLRASYPTLPCQTLKLFEIIKSGFNIPEIDSNFMKRTLYEITMEVMRSRRKQYRSIPQYNRL